jgi:hypothetical protein
MMDKSVKGALLSGLILPGLGQIVLKHALRGVVIIVTVLVSMSAIVVKTVQRALAILEKIDLEGGLISMETIRDAATEASTKSGNLTISLLFLLLLFCWIVSIVDAYRIGKRMDTIEHSQDQTSDGNDG